MENGGDFGGPSQVDTPATIRRIQSSSQKGLKRLRFFDGINATVEDLRNLTIGKIFKAFISSRENVRVVLSGGIPQSKDDGDDDDEDVVPLAQPLFDEQLAFTDDFQIIHGTPCFMLVANQGSKVVTCCLFSNDGSLLVSGYEDGYVRVWNASHGTLVKEQNVHASSVCDVQLEQGYGKDVVVSCDSTGRCSMWYIMEDKVYPLICKWDNWGDANEKASVIGYPFFTKPMDIHENKMPFMVIFPLQVDRLAAGQGDNEATRGLRVIVFDLENAQRLNNASVFGVAELQEVPPDHFMACCKLSPTYSSLLVGYIPTNPQEYDGLTFLWPDIRNKPHVSVRLQGGMAVWSRHARFVVTWGLHFDATQKTRWASSIYVWSFDELGLQGDALPFKAIESNGDQSICWCDFIESKSHQEYLVSCTCAPEMLVSVTLYDVFTFMPMHTVSTGIPTALQNWPLCSRAYYQPLDEADTVKKMKQIQPIAVTRQSSRVGALDVDNWRGVIVNILHGVEELRLNIPQSCVDQLQDCRGLTFASDEGNLALIGSHAIMVMGLASQQYRCKDSPNVSCVTKLTMEALRDEENTMLRFSGDGRFLGVLQLESACMHVHDLNTGQKMIVQDDSAYLISSFALSDDGKWLATCSCDMEIGLWEIRSKGVVLSEWVSKPAEGIMGRPKALCIRVNDTTSEIVIVCCDPLGDVVWLLAESMRGITSVSRLQLWRPHMWSSMNLSSSRMEESNPMVIKNVASTTKRGIGEHAAKFCSNGKWGVLMPSPGKVCVWDLEKQCRVREFTIRGTSDKVPHVAWSTVMQWINGEPQMGGPPRGEEEDEEEEVEELDVEPLAPEGLIDISECGRWKLVVEEKEEEAFLRTVYPFDTSPRHDTKGSTISIIDMEGKCPPRVLNASETFPHKGCVLSPDGRRLACVGDKNCIHVWSARATQGFIPDHYLLNQDRRTDDREYLDELLQEHGPALFNLPDQTGIPLLMQTVASMDFKMHDVMDMWKLKLKDDDQTGNVPGFKIRLQCDGGPDAVKLAINARSPSFLKKMIEALLDGQTQNYERAKILSSALGRLRDFYPVILSETLNDPRFLIDVCKIKIPEAAFSHNKGNSIVLTNDFLTAPAEEFQNMFEGKSRRKHVLVPAIVRAVPCPSAAQVHSGGLLTSLVIHNIPFTVFSAPPVKHIIQYKWRRYAQLYMLNEVAHYFMMLSTFTLYSFAMAQSPWQGRRELIENWKGRMTTAALFASVFLGAVNLLREVKQLLEHVTYSGLKGIVFYIQSAWNWVEISSYVLLVVVIPVVHFWKDPLNNTTLTMLISVESVTLWWKVLYYMRAFRPTGQLVISVSRIIADMVIWLILGFMVMVGFGTAFFVLYRHVIHAPTVNRGALIAGEFSRDDVSDLKTAFGSYGRALSTVFAFALGDFDLGILYNVRNTNIESPPKYSAMAFFVVYLFLVGIILLNLLIAIMADSYERIKEGAESEFLAARASAILDVETMMSFRSQREEREATKRFLHVIEPAEKQQKISAKDEVSTKLNEILMAVRDDTHIPREGDREMWMKIEGKIEEVVTQISELKKDT